MTLGAPADRVGVVSDKMFGAEGYELPGGRRCQITIVPLAVASFQASVFLQSRAIAFPSPVEVKSW